MKNQMILRRAVYSILIGLMSASSFSLAGEKIIWREFGEGVALAAKTKKKIIIDVYTDWCGWCKTMDAKTYANGDVAKYLNQHYVAVKVNAESADKIVYDGESMSKQEFSSAFGISGFPSTLFLNTDGKPITIYPGYAEPDMFKDILRYIAEDHYASISFNQFREKK